MKIPGGRTPRLCRGLAILPVDGGLLIEGAPHRQLFTGQATSLLLRLLSLLDGRHGLAAICAELACRATQLADALAVLDRCGLLEDGGTEMPAAAKGRRHVADYLSRSISATRRHRNAEDILEILSAARVLVVGNGGIIGQIAADLSESGIGTVHISERPIPAIEPTGPPGARHPRNIVIVQDDQADDSVLDDTVREFWHSDTPVLRFSHADTGLEVGPFFYSGLSPCTACYRRAVGVVDQGAERIEAHAIASLAAGLITMEALAVLTHMTAPISLRTLTKFTPPDYVAERYLVTSFPDCADCAACLVGACGSAPTAEVYEWQWEQPPAIPGWSDEEIYPEDRKPTPRRAGNIELPYSPRRTLTDMAALPGPRAADRTSRQAMTDIPAAIGAQSIEAILIRVAPSEGNCASSGLDSTDVYVMTDLSLAGRSSTIFKYDHVSRQITAVRADSIPLRSCLGGTDLDAGSCAFAVAFVGSLGRLRGRYGGSAVRLVHLDTGLAVTRLAMAAIGYRLSVSFASRWTGELARLLELDSRREVVTAVAGVYQETRDAECR